MTKVADTINTRNKQIHKEVHKQVHIYICINTIEVKVIYREYASLLAPTDLSLLALKNKWETKVKIYGTTFHFLKRFYVSTMNFYVRTVGTEHGCTFIGHTVHLRSRDKQNKKRIKDE